jgi:hypothetical protein
MAAVGPRGVQADRVFFVIVGSVALITRSNRSIKLSEGEAVGVVEYCAGAAEYMWPVVCRRKSTLYSISVAALTELFAHYPNELARMKAIAEQRQAAWNETERCFAKRLALDAPVEVTGVGPSLSSSCGEGGLVTATGPSVHEMVVELQRTTRELLSTQRELLDMLRDSLFPSKPPDDKPSV